MPRFWINAIVSIEELPPSPEDDMIIGQIFAYGGSTLPAKCLRCDGSAVSRTTYSLLFAALGTTWGAGDGSTTFNLPDCRGRVIVGAGNGAGLTPRALAANGGGETVTLAAGEMPGHTHTLSDPTHIHTLPSFGTFISGAPGTASYQQTAEAPAGSFNTDAASINIPATDAAGLSQAHANMQPWVAAFPLVYAGV